MKSQVDIVQLFADAWTEGALNTARFMEASTKSMMADAEPRASKSGWYRNPNQTDPMASFTDAMQAMATTGFAWWSPEFWSAMNKRSPSPLQTLAEPAFGSFVGLDPFSPLLVWEHILPDLASPAGWSPANVFNPTNWMTDRSGSMPSSLFGLPMSSETISTMFDPMARSQSASNVMDQWRQMAGGGVTPGFLNGWMSPPFMAPVSNPWLDQFMPSGTKSMSTMFALPGMSDASTAPWTAWGDAYSNWNKMVSNFTPGGVGKVPDITSPAMWMSNAFPFSGSEGIKVFVASITIPDDHLRKMARMFGSA